MLATSTFIDGFVPSALFLLSSNPVIGQPPLLAGLSQEIVMLVFVAVTKLNGLIPEGATQTVHVLVLPGSLYPLKFFATT